MKTPESSSPGFTNYQLGGLKQDAPTIGVTPVSSLGPQCFGNDGIQEV